MVIIATALVNLVCASTAVAGLNRESCNQFSPAGIGSNNLLFLALWQLLDPPFRLEGEASVPEPPLEDKLQGCSATQIPSASVATGLMLGKSPDDVSGNPYV